MRNRRSMRWIARSGRCLRHMAWRHCTALTMCGMRPRPLFAAQDLATRHAWSNCTGVIAALNSSSFRRHPIFICISRPRPAPGSIWSNAGLLCSRSVRSSVDRIAVRSSQNAQFVITLLSIAKTQSLPSGIKPLTKSLKRSHDFCTRIND